jgi:hypothetical protein
MKKVYVQPVSAGNGRFTYDLLDINGGFAGSNEFQYATIGEAYEAGVCHVQEFPESFTLATPAAVATLLKEAYYHMVTLRSFANARFVMGDISGLNRAISETEKMLFV